MLDQIRNSSRIFSPQIERSSSTPATALAATLRVLEKSDFRYVVLHGYEGFPEISGGDIDICIEGSATDKLILKLLRDNARELGCQVVSCRNGSVLLAGQNEQGHTFFLKLDLEHDYALNGLRFIAGRDILSMRRKYRDFHVPSPAHELAGYLATMIVKSKFDTARTSRLANLYQSDPTCSEREIARLWSGEERTVLSSALASNDWTQVVLQAPELRKRLVALLNWRSPLVRLADHAKKFYGRLQRLARPQGLSVVVLGPDGAGKSSVTQAIGGPDLMPIFNRSVCWGFVPPLHRLIGRNHGPSSQPHGLPARSLIGSLLKSGYWLVFSVLAHPRTYFMKARGGLVLYDRHFIDILVDATRYRYSGPFWILHTIWRIIPKPDLVVMLDAPVEEIQKRKKELSVEETARQLDAYRILVRALPNGIVINADKPFADVVADLNGQILAYYFKR